MDSSIVSIDPSTGVLLINGKKVFPIGFSNPPPIGGKAPSAKPALQELRDAGGVFVRTGIAKWNRRELATQVAEVERRFDEAERDGMYCWLWLGELPSHLPKRLQGKPLPVNQALLTEIVAKFKDHGALGAYKGFDEPLHNGMRPPDLVRAHKTLKRLDPNHPLVLIQAPYHPVGKLKPYAKQGKETFDITGADIFPISNPPADQARTQTKKKKKTNDISVVGRVTRKMVAASGGQPVWMTLQIAWSGTPYPKHVPCFPTLHEERFMVYQAIVGGARGLTFFGGHMTQVCTPEDAEHGWNWTFWRQVLKWIVQELSSDELQPALLAPSEPPAVKARTPGKPRTDVELITRRTSRFLYVIAVKSGPGDSTIVFSGLPRKKDGTAIKAGQVLFEHVQIPPPANKPKVHSQKPRPIKVANRGFRDHFRAYDVHVYRFAL